MRILKRMAGLLMTAALTLAMSATAFAAEGDTGFSDVDADAWYAEAAVYCRGTAGTPMGFTGPGSAA